MDTSRIERILNRFDRASRSGNGYIARCPAHDDRTPSLSISEGDDGHVLIHCHAGCDVEQVLATVGLEWSDLFPETRHQPIAGATTSGHRTDIQGCSLEQYASDKKLPVDFLMALGLTDTKRSGNPAVLIPYQDEVGRAVAKRYRLSLNGAKKMNWERGAQTSLYGLHRLKEAREKAYILIVEGESDTHTGWFHQVPVIGVPGSNMWREERDAAHFGGIDTIYLIEEPDEGGEKLLADISKSSIRTRVRVVKLGVFKDLSGLHIADPSKFDDRLDTFLSAAVPLPTIAAHSQDSLGGPVLQITTLADVQSTDVDWLWPGRIPRGKVTILGGDPDLGKSFLTLDLAARISTGTRLPDEHELPQGDVLIVTAEDSLEDTVKPRLESLGADTTRIHAIGLSVREGDREVALSLIEHLSAIEAKIHEFTVVLLIIDPLLAFTGSRNPNNSHEVRPLLTQLSEMAKRTNCAIVGIMHLNKTSTELNPLYRFRTSLDFVAAARSALLVGKHPDAPDRRVLAVVKMNVGKRAKSMAFHINDDGVFCWDGETDIDAAGLLPSPQSPEHISAIEEAESFLLETLSDGPVEAKIVRNQAKDAGMSSRTLERAKNRLEIISSRFSQGNDGKGYWAWALPNDSQERQPDIYRDGDLANVTSQIREPRLTDAHPYALQAEADWQDRQPKELVADAADDELQPDFGEVQYDA